MQLESKAEISDWLKIHDRLFDTRSCAGELGLKEPVGFCCVKKATRVTEYGSDIWAYILQQIRRIAPLKQ